MRVAFIGDPHVGKMCRLVGPEQGLRLHSRSLRDQLRLAREDGATHVAILGDLFDTPFPDQNQLLVVLQALADTDLPVLVYLGNHDVHDAAHNSFRLLCRLPEVGALRHVTFVTERRLIRFGDLRVAVIPWGARVPKGLRGRADLVLFHESVVGALRDNGTMVPPGRGLPSNAFDGVLAVGGHLHTPHRRERVVYPGTYTQMGFGEKPDKKRVIADFERGRLTRIERLSVDDPTWRLEAVKFSKREPPKCSDPKTFYSLDVSDDRPGPGWLVDHPRVVRVHGGSGKAQRAITERVVSIMEGSAVHGEDDRALLARWLNQHARIDSVSRAAALRIHDRLARDE